MLETMRGNFCKSPRKLSKSDIHVRCRRYESCCLSAFLECTFCNRDVIFLGFDHTRSYSNSYGHDIAGEVESCTTQEGAECLTKFAMAGENYRRCLLSVNAMGAQCVAGAAVATSDLEFTDCAETRRRRRRLASTVGVDGSECVACSPVDGATAVVCSLPNNSRAACQTGLSLIDNSANYGSSDVCYAASITCISNFDGFGNPFPADVNCTDGLSAPAVLSSQPCLGSLCTAAECCVDDNYCATSDPCGAGSVCVDLPAPNNYTCACADGYFASNASVAIDGSGCLACTPVANSLFVTCTSASDSKPTCSDGWYVAVAKGTGDATCEMSSCVCDDEGEILKSPTSSVAPIAMEITSAGDIAVLPFYAPQFTIGQTIVVRDIGATNECAASGRYNISNISEPITVEELEVVYLQLSTTTKAPATALAVSACEVAKPSSSWGNAWFGEMCAEKTCSQPACCQRVNACAPDRCTTPGSVCVATAAPAVSYSCVCQSGFYRSRPHRSAAGPLVPSGAACLPCPTVANALAVTCAPACSDNINNGDDTSSAACDVEFKSVGFTSLVVGPSRVVACELGYGLVNNTRIPNASDACIRVNDAFCPPNFSDCGDGMVNNPAMVGLACAAAEGGIASNCTADDCCMDEDGCAGASCPGGTVCQDIPAPHGHGTLLGEAYHCICTAGSYSRLAPIISPRAIPPGWVSRTFSGKMVWPHHGSLEISLLPSMFVAALFLLECLYP